MMASGELATAKGGKKAPPKKKMQAVDRSEVRGMSAKAAGKRKRRDNETMEELSVEFVPGDVVPWGSTMASTSRPRSATKPYVLDADVTTPVPAIQPH